MWFNSHSRLHVCAFVHYKDDPFQFCKLQYYRLFLLASNLDPFGEMHLLPEPLFALPSDNTCMLDVTGTCIGRIFMGGKDGCLYEVLYQVSVYRILSRSLYVDCIR